MVTEVLGFFIIMGALVVFVLRRQMKPAESEKFEVAADRLRYELEHSADEIIVRMEDHMGKLEALIAEADKRAALLDKKLDMLKGMPQQKQMDFPHILQESMEGESRDLSVAKTLEAALGVEQETEEVQASPELDSEGIQGQESLPMHASRVRALLQQGYSTEAIAKETNMGKSAIELIRQMNRVHQ